MTTLEELEKRISDIEDNLEVLKNTDLEIIETLNNIIEVLNNDE